MRGYNSSRLNRGSLKDSFRQAQPDEDANLEEESGSDLSPPANPFDSSYKSVRWAMAEGQRRAGEDEESTSSSGSSLVDSIARRFSPAKSVEKKRKEQSELLLRLFIAEQIRRRLAEIDVELGKAKERLKGLEDIITRTARGEISFERGLSASDRAELEKAGVDVGEMEDVADSLKHLKAHNWDYKSLSPAQQAKLKDYGIFEQNLNAIAQRSGGDIDRIMAGVIDRTYAEEVRQKIRSLEAEKLALIERLDDVQHNRGNNWESDPIIINLLEKNQNIDLSAMTIEQRHTLEGLIEELVNKKNDQIVQYDSTQNQDIITRRPLEEYVKPPEDIEVREFYKKLDEIKDLPDREKLEKEYELVLDLSKDAKVALKTDESLKEVLNLDRYKPLFEEPTPQPAEVEEPVIKADGKINLAALGMTG